jgi:formamidopyrimidine-DNA glycosylase
MPELPEVETITRLLREGGEGQPSLLGCTIRDFDLLWPDTLAEPPPKQFRRLIIGQEFKAIDRRGKYLVFDLSEHHLLIHLRMSGDILVGEGEQPLGKYSRLALYMENGVQLSFNDARKFGRAWLVDDPQRILGKLGPEPLDESFTAEAFHQRLQARRRQLKPLLLDQSFLAGLGNIYVDEALHLARLHPLTIANALTRAQAGELLAAIRQVLREGIRRNGSSIDWVYRGGDFQNQFRAYQRTGEPCPECGTPIERTVVGQRSTHICPQCQPSPPTG